MSAKHVHVDITSLNFGKMKFENLRSKRWRTMTHTHVNVNINIYKYAKRVAAIYIPILFNCELKRVTCFSDVYIVVWLFLIRRIDFWNNLVMLPINTKSHGRIRPLMYKNDRNENISFFYIMNVTSLWNTHTHTHTICLSQYIIGWFLGVNLTHSRAHHVSTTCVLVHIDLHSI